MCNRQEQKITTEAKSFRPAEPVATLGSQTVELRQTV